MVCQTSSARWMRCESFGASRCAVVGSTAASAACSAGQPRCCASAAIRARTAGSAAGMASSPSNSALKYSMVPPTSSGLRPRACISPMSRVASATNMAALYACSGSRMSIRWCGTAASSAADGLAVPMSMPRYTRAESTLMISTGRRCATASAAAVLPDAVGPARQRGDSFISRPPAPGATRCPSVAPAPRRSARSPPPRTRCR